MLAVCACTGFLWAQADDLGYDSMMYHLAFPSLYARAGGLVVRADDEDVPLAAVRGCERVVVAAAGPWVAELLCGPGNLPSEAPAVLRAALGVALAG